MIENLLKQNEKINLLIQEILRKNTINIKKSKIEFLPGYSIIKSGISNFEGNKIYLDTASVNKTIIESTDYIITQTNKPSRANMQPIPNSIWFAKLKDSPKYLFVLDYMTDILNEYIFSTGFLGLKTANSKIANYFYALITSADFAEQKNRLSIGATMQGINNDSFKEILVPNLSIETMEKIGSQIEELTKIIYINNCKISNLKNQNKQYLKKYFG